MKNVSFHLAKFVSRTSCLVFTFLWLPFNAFADLPTLVQPPRQLPHLLVGFVCLSGLRLYVAPQYRPLCVSLYEGKVGQVLPAIRAQYQINPTNGDIHVMRSQADPTFRREEWNRYKNEKRKNADICFRRGVTLLYQFYEQSNALPRAENQKIIKEAVTDLRLAWHDQPSVISGAMLLSAYDADLMMARTFKPAFEIEYLRFLDEEHAYKAYEAARGTGFSEAAPQLVGIPAEKIRPVVGVLSERWSSLGGTSSKSKEVEVLNRWWRDLRRQIPPP